MGDRLELGSRLHFVEREVHEGEREREREREREIIRIDFFRVLVFILFFIFLIGGVVN